MYECIYMCVCLCCIATRKTSGHNYLDAINAYYFCENTLENPNQDHVLKQSLKQLRSLKKIDEKDITNPYHFKDAPKLTTFVRLAGNRTKELWNFIDEASQADIMLVDTKNPMLKKMLPFCSGRVPILVHPSFYRSLKLRYPVDADGLTQGSGAELSADSVIPGNSPDIHGIPQF